MDNRKYKNLSVSSQSHHWINKQLLKLHTPFFGKSDLSFLLQGKKKGGGGKREPLSGLRFLGAIQASNDNTPPNSEQGETGKRISHLQQQRPMRLPGSLLSRFSALICAPVPCPHSRCDAGRLFSGRRHSPEVTLVTSSSKHTSSRQAGRRVRGKWEHTSSSPQNLSHLKEQPPLIPKASPPTGGGHATCKGRKARVPGTAGLRISASTKPFGHPGQTHAPGATPSAPTQRALRAHYTG